jgi:putative CocE/NonD family hydrolase
MLRTRATTAQADAYTSDPHALPPTDYTGGTGTGGLWGNASQWTWDWKQWPDGKAVSYVSPPLTQDTTVVGAGSVEVWVRSSTPDVDLQATISEVRPDGKEVFVQNGWMRASDRTLSSDPNNIFRQPSTLLEPVPSLLPSDVQPMPSGQYVKVTIPLYYEGHAYRAGSRLRLTISAPNGTQPIWAFDETQPPSGTATVSIAHSPAMPSRLVLPVIAGATIPTKMPACGSLRNEPCRDYVPVTNHPAP